jgi:transcription termination factor Rho
MPGTPTAPEGQLTGWFDVARDGGFIRRPETSYLPDPTDTFVPPALVRLHQLRRGDKIEVTYGRDHRGRSVAMEVLSLNEGSPVVLEKRPDFNALTASYPDRKLKLETGRPAKTGPELTRRAIDLISPIGYGQRALIVAPARAGKTTLLQAIIEGVAINHPEAVLLILLVDERPEEVSEMVDWGYGEVVASSFDMPPKRHVEVAEMTLERARRLVEMGKDVVIVLDSITRLARAHNTVDRGTGRTMSGGLDATAMQKPKAFFGSARMIAPQHGGGSLTIIATALVETGSRMDDVIFEEFKGTGNSEIKLDRSLADRRIFPAFDIATSGTRREEKLYRPDQLEKVYLLRRGLHQMPPQAAMEWLIKRIASTTNNDSLLDGL